MEAQGAEYSIDSDRHRVRIYQLDAAHGRSLHTEKASPPIQGMLTLYQPPSHGASSHPVAGPIVYLGHGRMLSVSPKRRAVDQPSATLGNRTGRCIISSIGYEQIIWPQARLHCRRKSPGRRRGDVSVSAIIARRRSFCRNRARHLKAPAAQRIFTIMFIFI